MATQEEEEVVVPAPEEEEVVYTPLEEDQVLAKVRKYLKKNKTGMKSVKSLYMDVFHLNKLHDKEQKRLTEFSTILHTLVTKGKIQWVTRTQQIKSYYELNFAKLTEADMLDAKQTEDEYNPPLEEEPVKKKRKGGAAASTPKLKSMSEDEGEEEEIKPKKKKSKKIHPPPLVSNTEEDAQSEGLLAED